MDEPVNAEEVKFVDDRHDKRHGGERPRIFGKAEPGRITIGIGPQHCHFDGGPDGHAGKEGSQDVVEVLAFEPEGLALLLGRKLAIIFETVFLPLQNIEMQFEAAVKRKTQTALTA